MKRKGLYVTSLDQWESFKEIFNNEKALELIQAIDKLKAKPEQEQSTESEEVFKL